MDSVIGSDVKFSVILSRLVVMRKFEKVILPKRLEFLNYVDFQVHVERGMWFQRSVLILLVSEGAVDFLDAMARHGLFG